MVEPNMNHDYNSNETESTAHLEMVERGRRIVQTIAIIYIVLQIISFFISFNFISLIIGIAIAAGLMSGKNWVRILYLIFSGIGIVIVLLSLSRLAEIATIPAWLILLGVFSIGVTITFMVLLTANQSVLAFFESNRCTCNK